MASNEITADIVARFKVDKRSQAELQVAVAQVEQEVGGIGAARPSKFLANMDVMRGKLAETEKQAVALKAQIAGIGGGGGSALGSIIAGGIASILVYKAPDIGLAIGNAIARQLQGPGYKTQTLGDVGKTIQTANLTAILQLTVALEHLGLVSDETRHKVAEWARGIVYRPPDAAVSAFAAFQKAQVAAEQQYEDQRTQIVQQAGQQRAQIEQTYEQTRTNILAQFSQQNLKAAQAFSRQEAQAEQQYYQSRLNLSRSFSIEVQRAEEDHQREMRRMREDHNDRIATLEGDRDAYGIILEQRAYERDRRNAEEDYRVAARRRSEDFARQIAEMEAQFAAQRAQRYADYALQAQERAEQEKQRLKEAEDNRKAELAKLAQSTQEKLYALQKAYNAERTARVTAFNDQLRDLGVFLGAEFQTKAQWYAAELALLKSYIAQIPPPGTPGLAMGGNVTAGRAYIVGERRAELFVPRQSGHVYPSVGGAGGITLNIRYSGEVTSTARREVAKIAREAALQGVSLALKGA